MIDHSAVAQPAPEPKMQVLRTFSCLSWPRWRYHFCEAKGKLVYEGLPRWFCQVYTVEEDF